MNRNGSRLRRPVRIALALLVLSGGTFAATATVDAADEAPGAVATARSAEALVEALGDAEYAVREAAAAELLADPSARPALEAGREHPDLEIRLRSGEILKRLVRDDRERRLSAFLADPASVEKSELPGWSQLERAVGAGRTARDTYVAIYRKRPETLEAIAQGPSAAEAELLRLTQLLQGAMHSRLPDMDDVVAAMLLDECAPPEASYERVALVHNLLSSIQLQQNVHAEPESTPAMRLLKRWVARDPGPAMRQFKLRTAMLYQFGPEALDLSRKTLAAGDAKQSSDPIATAMLALARYGNQTDAAALSQYLDEDEVCHNWFKGNAQPVKIQIRDVAMAVALHLRGQEPKAFGFPLVERQATSVFAIHTLGFENDADRAATLRKFGEWARTSKAIELPADFEAKIPQVEPAKSDDENAGS